MRCGLLILMLLAGAAIVAADGKPEPGSPSFSGKYCDGIGDAQYLELIDESFRFFHADPALPNLVHLYQPEWDTFVEGFGWGGWWIQNSYGFSYCATPFLQEPWITLLQQSWDLHWTNQGDGIRMGRYGAITRILYSLVGPDGALGDTATPSGIVYKQGDGKVEAHDWYYEGTAAGVVMEGEILLRNRDISAALTYLPKMHRACEFIEKTRDPDNNLFFVGPASNLLAPSFGGIKEPDGSFGKAYLAGLSITYTAALERMVELYKLVGDPEKEALYEHRLERTRESLPLLLAPKGYFVKSLEKNGTMHGVVGQKRFGYFEGVANADALGLRIADDETAKTIYAGIASLPQLRPFDFLLTNAPGLDDTYWNYGSTDVGGHYLQFGDWVNGGVWGTVEGRAIMGYYRLEKFSDVLASASRAMRWAKDFRMDAPWSQRGENTHNWWSDNPKRPPTSIMIDNFAIPAATIRGLFEWIYKHDRVILYPHVPPGITFYRQKEPVWFGGKRITVECVNGDGPIESVSVNGKPVVVESSDHFSLMYDDLPEIAQVVIAMKGASLAEVPPSVPEARSVAEVEPASDLNVPEVLKERYAVLRSVLDLLADRDDAGFDKAFVREALDSIAAVSEHSSIDLGPGYFRPFTPERLEDITQSYETAAMNMYNGLARRMTIYANSGNPEKKRIAGLFVQAGGELVK